MTRCFPARSLRLLVVLALAAVLPACGTALGGGREALTIYSGRTQNLVGPLLEQFAQERGIAIDVKYGDSAELALLLAEEGDRTPADVFLSQSPGATEFLAEQGLLAPLPAETIESVQGAVADEDARWVGVTARQRVLVYNTDLLDESDLPASVLDVVEPRYEDRVAVAPSNASFQDFVTAMRRARGDDATRAWLEGLARNGAPTYANNNAIVEAVGRGEVEMGLVNHYYAYRFLDEDPQLPVRNHVFRDDLGSLLLPSAVSVLAHNDKPVQAREFVAFLLSEEAQEYFSQKTFEYPLAAGVPAAPALPPLDVEAAPVLGVDIAEDLGEGLERTVELIRASGLTDA